MYKSGFRNFLCKCYFVQLLSDFMRPAYHPLLSLSNRKVDTTSFSQQSTQSEAKIAPVRQLCYCCDGINLDIVFTVIVMCNV